MRYVSRWLAAASACGLIMLAMLAGLGPGAQAVFLSAKMCLYVRARAHGLPSLS
jgi:hypothetical protein